MVNNVLIIYAHDSLQTYFVKYNNQNRPKRKEEDTHGLIHP